MGSKIVLVSDDSDFFEYIRAKLELRKSDELFTFSFDQIPDKIQFIQTAVIIVNSESSNEKTLDFLGLFNGTPIIISAYNDDDTFRRKCFRAGAFDFITIMIPDAEFRARMIPALSVSTLLLKNKQYRDILVDNKYIMPENDIYVGYEELLDKYLQEISSTGVNAVFGAIAPNEKSKYLLKPALIESIILNNIRKNDVVMNYAPNKYFVLLFDTNLESVYKIWNKISKQAQQPLFAGFTSVRNQKRQQIVNEALNKLHEAISQNRTDINLSSAPVDTLNILSASTSSNANFKLFKQEFTKKIEQVIAPVFYQFQQRYDGVFTGVLFQQSVGDGYGLFSIKNKYYLGTFKVTSSGFSKINVDISFQKNEDLLDSKRIVLDPEELEAGLLEDLLEQFVLEYKRSIVDGT